MKQANQYLGEFYDADGRLVASYAYDGFGRTVAQSGPMADAFSLRYSTKYMDPETGLSYFGYRYYSPQLGRWLTRDPLEEDGGINLYGFCGNDGVNRYDALGKSWNSCFEEWRLDWASVFGAFGLTLFAPVNKTADELIGLGETGKLRKQTSVISKAMHKVVMLAKRISNSFVEINQ